MDESRVQQTESDFKNNCPTADADTNQRAMALPLPERNSDNDANHEGEGETFVLGYN